MLSRQNLMLKLFQRNWEATSNIRGNVPVSGNLLTCTLSPLISALVKIRARFWGIA